MTDRAARRTGRLIGAGVAAVALTMLSPRVGATTDTVPIVDAVTDTTFVWNLEKEPSECIGFLPKPGCGKAPEQAGDRGGALQWAVFGFIMAGVGVIGTVIVRNIIRRDRAIAQQMSANQTSQTPSPQQDN